MRSFILLLVIVISVTNSTRVSAQEAGVVNDIESIPWPIMQQLKRATYIENYIVSVIQQIRSNGMDGISLSLEDVKIKRIDYDAKMRANQVSQVLNSDINNDGKVTKKEVENLIKARRKNLTPEHLERQVSRVMKYDTNKDGVVEYLEMRTLFLINYPNNQFEQMEDIVALDPNDDGKITVKELKKIAVSSFNVVDTNNDGILSNDEKKI